MVSEEGVQFQHQLTPRALHFPDEKDEEERESAVVFEDEAEGKNNKRKEMEERDEESSALMMPPPFQASGSNLSPPLPSSPPSPPPAAAVIEKEKRSKKSRPKKKSRTLAAGPSADPPAADVTRPLGDLSRAYPRVRASLLDDDFLFAVATAALDGAALGRIEAGWAEVEAEAARLNRSGLELAEEHRRLVAEVLDRIMINEDLDEGRLAREFRCVYIAFKGEPEMVEELVLLYEDTLGEMNAQWKGFFRKLLAVLGRALGLWAELLDPIQL